MDLWYSYGLWSFGIFFPLWDVRTKLNLATLELTQIVLLEKGLIRDRFIEDKTNSK
jgi:hypothetical protein